MQLQQQHYKMQRIGGVSFNGSADINLLVLISVVIKALQEMRFLLALATLRNIGGVAFDGSASINLRVNATGNQDTSGNAAMIQHLPARTLIIVLTELLIYL